MAATFEFQTMTPIAYAKKAYQEERYPNITIYDLLDGRFSLGDSDGRLFMKAKTYATKDAAYADRSKILDKAQRAAA